LKVDMSIIEQMNHKQVVLVNDHSVGVTQQTSLNDDDDHPPSRWRTVVCVLPCVILPAWVRKA